MKKWILIIALLAGAFAAGLLTGRGRSTPDIVEVRDTLTFHDTVFIDRPVPVYVTQIRTDTVRLALVDSSCTVIVRDSARVEIPISRKVYEDSTYRAVISGYNASLDSIWVRSTLMQINVVKSPKNGQKRYGFGITAGPSVLATPDGSIKAGVGMTAGLTYRF